MFNVTVNNTTYKVVFQHINEPALTITLQGGEMVKRCGTVCQITSEFINKFYVAGHACLKPGDQPDKNMGRKYALRHTLDGIFTAEERRVFWEAYFEARGGKY